MRNILTLITGMIFGTGIAMSGMANPAKVINFFDIAGSWDPSLVFVMGGAVVVTFIGYRLVLGRERPIYEPQFDIPQNRKLDTKLLAGAGIFGVGWGIAGFCPGGALPVVGTGNVNVLLFMVALIAGMFFARFLMSRSGTGGKATQPAE